MNVRQMLLGLTMLAALLLPRAATAQEGIAAQVLLLGTNVNEQLEMTVPVVVADRSGRPINDLPPSEIALAVAGQPLTPTVQLAQQPPAIAIVADMSAGMADQSFPAQGRVPTMVAQAQRMLSLMPPDTEVTLVTFGAQQPQATRWDTVAATGQQLESLLARPLPVVTPDAPYGLNAAIDLALQQFGAPGQPSTGRPRALFVYTAGTANQAVDTAAMQRRIDALAPNPPTVVLVGLGSRVAGEFANLPGNPESLMQAASEGNTNYYRFYGADPAETQLLQAAIDRQSEQVANLASTLLLKVPDVALAPGVHQLELTIHGIAVTQRFRVPLIPPQIALPALTEPLADGAILSVDVQVAQQPVREVIYSIGEQLIGRSSAGPDFPVTLDLTQLGLDPAEQATYQLSAVAVDTAGQESQPARTRIEVAAPLVADDSEAEPATLLITVVILATALVLLAGTALFLTITSRGREVLGTLIGSARETPLGTDARWADGLTILSDPPLSGTGEYTQPSASPASSVEVVFGQQRYPVLNGSKLSLGRSAENAIVLPDKEVSLQHARVELTSGGLRLTDLGSRNGTYIGERKRRLATNGSDVLRPGDSFWIGPNVRLVVR